MPDSSITRAATINEYQGLSEVYRDADDYHADGLPAVFTKTSAPARNPEFIRSILEDDNSILLVAENANTIVGLVHATVRNTPELPVVKPLKYVYVNDIAVRSGFRNQGVGSLLMDDVKKWAIKQKAQQIRLNVWDFNRSAIQFYQDAGYTAASHLMWQDIG